MKKLKGVLALFEHLDTTTEALKSIQKREDFERHEVYSPASYHELMEVIEPALGASAVRWCTLVGSLVGCAVGFLMPTLMDYDWPLVVGGKTAGLNSAIPNVIFMFELFILLGALATIVAMLWFGRLANPRAQILDPSLTDDRFAIFVPGALLGGVQANYLKELGAYEVKQIDGATENHSKKN